MQAARLPVELVREILRGGQDDQVSTQVCIQAKQL